MNARYLLKGKEFPAIFIAFGAFGLITKRYWRSVVFLIFWFLAFWSIFLFFYAGGYRSNANERFALMSMPAAALIAGLGVRKAWTLLIRWMRARSAWIVVGSILAVHLLAYLPYLRELPEMNWESRDDHAAAEYFATLVPRDGIVMTNNPILYHLSGIDACQMTVLLEDANHVENYLKKRYREMIYFHWDYWCNTQGPDKPGLCRVILERYPWRLIAERHYEGRRYALYQISHKASAGL